MEKSKLSTIKYRYSPLTRYGRNLLRKVNRAFSDFSLITDDDRVLVAVSGGKDSLSLLYLLMEHKRFYNGKFEVDAVHVVSDYTPNAEKQRKYLDDIFDSLDVRHGFPKITVTRDLEGNEKEPTCFLCSWKRREALFKYCVDNGYTKLAFGHHSDDVAETTLMNLVYHGNLETMLPIRSFFDGKFSVIRPLFYVREKDLVKYSELAGFDTTSCVCPQNDSGKRKMMKNILRELAPDARQLNANLWNASHKWWKTFGDTPTHKHPRRSLD